MDFPKLTEYKRAREYTQAFKGYNHNLRIEETEFYDMKNMTADEYPVISTRPYQYTLAKLKTPCGLVSHGLEKPFWIDEYPEEGYSSYLSLYDNGQCVASLFLSKAENMLPKQMVKMGSKICIFPDAVWFDRQAKEVNINKSWGKMAYKATPVGGSSVSFAISNASGNGYTIKYKQAETPANTSNPPKDGDYWLYIPTDTEKAEGKTTELKRRISGAWVGVTSTYVKITGDAQMFNYVFRENDIVDLYSTHTVPGFIETSNTNTEDDFKHSKYAYCLKGAKIVSKGYNYIVVVGIMNTDSESYTENQPSGVNAFHFGVERTIPDMSFVCENNNRLWGCSKDGHEIYCSKLGDSDNWWAYDGISTDAEAITVGTDGEFTGCAVWNGTVLFFKENCIHKVYGSNPPYQVTTIECEGIQKGSWQSAVNIGGVLYYKARTGIYAYTGSLPVRVSDNLGTETYYDAVCGSLGNLLYVSMRNAKGEYNLFILDTEKGIWMKGSDTQMLYCCECDGDLYYIDAADNCLKTMRGSKGNLVYIDKESGESIACRYAGPPEGPFDWFLETGEIGLDTPDKKRVSRLSLRLQLESAAWAAISVMYDSSGHWKRCAVIRTHGLRSVNIPITPTRCDHLKLKISGHGSCKIYGLSKMYENGSWR